MAADDPIPSRPAQSNADKLAVRRSAEQSMLMREVDDAVRQDQLGTAMRQHGIRILIAVVVVLAAFGGWLLWRDSRESAREERSEQLVTAFDELEGGRASQAVEQLTPLAAEDGAAGASAALALAAIELRDNKADAAIRRYEALAADDDVPLPYRDYARIRAVAERFDALEPQVVIDRLKPLATPGNAWFGSAGELVAMAYLKQGREELAAPLLGEIAKNEDVPQTLRSRARQLAGLLGFDAVVDVEDTLEQLQREQGGPAAAAAPAPAAPAAPAPAAAPAP